MIHQDENIYWTGEKVLKARDMFKIIVCVVDDKIVAVEYKNQIGLSFHPELDSDMRIMGYFFDKCTEWKRA